jgi:hypothetical protein
MASVATVSRKTGKTGKMSVKSWFCYFVSEACIDRKRRFTGTRR